MLRRRRYFQAKEVHQVCLAADEPGGPRRCSSDARCTLERSTAAVCILTDRSAELRRAVTGGAVNVPEPVADAVAVAAVAGVAALVGKRNVTKVTQAPAARVESVQADVAAAKGEHP